MITLHLLRHAKSSRDEPALSDFERPLSKRGKKDAPAMGRELAGLGAKPDVIVSSPAVRAITTARLAAEELSFPADKIVEEPLIYEAGLSDLLSVVSRVGGSFKEALLCGHNPGLTYLAEELSGQPVGSIPTCGVFSMDFNAASWDGITPGSGRVRFFIFPKAFED